MSANLAVSNAMISPLATGSPSLSDNDVTLKPGSLDGTDASLSADFAAMLVGLMPTPMMPVMEAPLTDASLTAADSGLSADAVPVSLEGSPGLLAQAALPPGLLAKAQALFSTTPLQVDLSLQQQTAPPPLTAAAETNLASDPTTAQSVPLAELQVLVDSFTQSDQSIAGDKVSLSPADEATLTESLSPLATPTASAAQTLNPLLQSGQLMATQAITDPGDATSESDDILDAALLNETIALNASDFNPAELAGGNIDPTAELNGPAPVEVTAKGQPDKTAVDQVSDEVEAMTNHGRHQVNLNLNPENLGSIRINLQRGADGQMNARFVVERPEAMAQLQANSQELTDKLAGQGITLNRVDWVLAGQALNAPARVEATAQNFSGQNTSDQNPQGGNLNHQQQQNQQQQQAQMLFQQGQGQPGQRWGQPQAYAIQSVGGVDAGGAMATDGLSGVLNQPLESGSSLRNAAGRINLEV